MLSLLRLRARQFGALLVALAGLLTTGLALAVPAGADSVRNAEQWVLDEMNVQPAWAVTEGQHVVVAVIDSGVNPDVSDLAGSVIGEVNLSGVDTPATNPNWGVHGTWMASLIAGHGHDGGTSGILGTAPRAKVLSVRVIADATDPNYSAYEHESVGQGQRELAEAIRYSVSHGASVISMSLGYGAQSAPVREALQDAYDHKVVVVAAAGNSGDQAGAVRTGHAPYSFPANYPGVLAVAAVNAQGQVDGFSSDNLSVQVAAPGYDVPAQGRNGQYWLVSGTSPACALTAGVAALIKSKYPGLSDAQVISAITSTTAVASRPPGGYDKQIGFGIVDAAAALAAAGRIAAFSPPAVGLKAASHFGGGVAAIPPLPVPPRGPAELVLYCMLGAGCLAVVGFASSRLFALREESGPAAQPPVPLAAGEPDLVRPPAAGRHAAPRGADDAAGPK